MAPAAAPVAQLRVRHYGARGLGTSAENADAARVDAATEGDDDKDDMDSLFDLPSEGPRAVAPVPSPRASVGAGTLPAGAVGVGGVGVAAALGGVTSAEVARLVSAAAAAARLRERERERERGEGGAGLTPLWGLVASGATAPALAVPVPAVQHAPMARSAADLVAAARASPRGGGSSGGSSSRGSGAAGDIAGWGRTRTDGAIAGFGAEAPEVAAAARAGAASTDTCDLEDGGSDCDTEVLAALGDSTSRRVTFHDSASVASYDSGGGGGGGGGGGRDGGSSSSSGAGLPAAVHVAAPTPARPAWHPAGVSTAGARSSGGSGGSDSRSGGGGGGGAAGRQAPAPTVAGTLSRVTDLVSLWEETGALTFLTPDAPPPTAASARSLLHHRALRSGSKSPRGGGGGGGGGRADNWADSAGAPPPPWPDSLVAREASGFRALAGAAAAVVDAMPRSRQQPTAGESRAV